MATNRRNTSCIPQGTECVHCYFETDKKLRGWGGVRKKLCIETRYEATSLNNKEVLHCAQLLHELV